MSDDFPALFRYFRWADERLIAACRTISHDRYIAEPAHGWSSLRSTVAHLAGAAELWLQRLSGGANPTTIRSDADLPTLDDSARLLDETHDGFDRYVAGLSPAQLGETFSYVSMAGRETSAPLWSVLRHVVNHGTYHRGQAASKIHLLGGERPATDLLLWAMEQSTPHS
jgi:uncharacterized damage-inducible protein DinB